MADKPTKPPKIAVLDVIPEMSLQRPPYWMAVGFGISEWSEMEGRLVGIAAILLDTTEEKAGLVLYSIINFHAWLSIIDELFKMDPKFRTAPHKKHRRKWGRIHESLRSLHDTRTRLAHHSISGPNAELDVELAPSPFDTRTKTKRYRPLGMRSMMNFGYAVHAVAKQIAELKVAMHTTAFPRKSS